MNLTKEYIQYRMGKIGRVEIVNIVDSVISGSDSDIDKLMDLSLSELNTDFEFENELLKFVDLAYLTKENLTPIIIAMVKKSDAYTAHKLLVGLSWLVYELDIDEPISKLYYNLEHLYNDAIPNGYAKYKDVDSFMALWIQEFAT